MRLALAVMPLCNLKYFENMTVNLNKLTVGGEVPAINHDALQVILCWFINIKLCLLFLYYLHFR